MDATAGPPMEDRAPLSYASVLKQQPDLATSSTPKPVPGSFKGEISGFFPPELIAAYARPFSRAVVGKFSKGRPSMKDIRTFLKAQDFSGPFSVGLINPRHILIRFDLEKDFHRCYSRSLWYVSDQPMRVFKWTSDFHPNRESSLVPVWFKFQDLPIHFYNREALFFLGSLFGVPLRMDTATASLVRPSVARLQVKIDLQKELPSHIWINLGDNKGFWQHLEPDGPLPSYCSHCWHLGHSDENCNIKHPELKQLTNNAEMNNNIKGNSKLVYRVVRKNICEELTTRGEKDVPAENESGATGVEVDLVGKKVGGIATLDKGKAIEDQSLDVNAIVDQALDKGKSAISVEVENSNRISNRFEQVRDGTEAGTSNQTPIRFEKGVENADASNEEEECFANYFTVNRPPLLPQNEEESIERVGDGAEITGEQPLNGENTNAGISIRISNRFDSLNRFEQGEGITEEEEEEEGVGEQTVEGMETGEGNDVEPGNCTHSDNEAVTHNPTVQAIPPTTSASEGEKSKPKSQMKVLKTFSGKSNVRTRSANHPKIR